MIECARHPCLVRLSVASTSYRSISPLRIYFLLRGISVMIPHCFLFYIYVIYVFMLLRELETRNLGL